MNGEVVSFLRPRRRPRDWDSQELAEFYRVEASLARSGLALCADRGLSDEGDPWFAFCRCDTGDVIVHFARIDGEYVVASPALETCARGRQFRPLIQSLIDSHPVVVPRSKTSGTIVIHPAALLVALVTICFYKLGQFGSAAAAELAPAPPVPGATQPSAHDLVRSGRQETVLDDQTSTAALAVIAAAAAWLVDPVDARSVSLRPRATRWRSRTPTWASPRPPSSSSRPSFRISR